MQAIFWKSSMGFWNVGFAQQNIRYPWVLRITALTQFVFDSAFVKKKHIVYSNEPNLTLIRSLLADPLSMFSYPQKSPLLPSCPSLLDLLSLPTSLWLIPVSQCLTPSSDSRWLYWQWSGSTNNPLTTEVHYIHVAKHGRSWLNCSLFF